MPRGPPSTKPRADLPEEALAHALLDDRRTSALDAAKKSSRVNSSAGRLYDPRWHANPCRAQNPHPSAYCAAGPVVLWRRPASSLREEDGLADEQRHRPAQPVPRDQRVQLRQSMRLIRFVIGMKVLQIGEMRRRIIGAETQPAICFMVSLIARPNPIDIP